MCACVSKQRRRKKEEEKKIFAKKKVSENNPTTHRDSFISPGAGRFDLHALPVNKNNK